ncbi:PucR family transcriptional regulator [Streptomyces fradiae]|uniref:PucR family transcriptional regulator n=1 Tax=Streptomyces fradiae TaxID=1906 RepID=UPI0029430DB3|nr:PucR family transcriptional regulator [Streptomyces fradiae]WOI59318.1 PucR family transcriptional regulator [Streptomyces fradiae]
MTERAEAAEPVGPGGPAGPVEAVVSFGPPVRLAALLARRELGLRLVAGDPGAELHWVHTSEMADPYPYLLGGELLLTAGVQLADAGADPERFVARAAQAGAAALGFGVTPVYDTVPEALAAACARHGLPLVEVEPGTTFAAVARAVWRLRADARLHELRRVTDAQRALATAAARPGPVPAVLKVLAGRLGGRAALYAPDGSEYAAAGRGLTPEEAAALSRLVAVVARAERRPSSASDTVAAGGAVGPGGGAGGAGSGAGAPGAAGGTGGSGTEGGPGAVAARGTGGPGMAGGPAGPGPGTAGAPAGPGRGTGGASRGVRLVAYSLGTGREGLTLGLALARHEEADQRIAETAMVLLSLLTAPHQGADEATRSAALVRLLLGARPEEVAPLLGEAPWTVVHARGGDGQAPPALGTPLVDAAGGTVRALLPAGREAEPQPGWTLGVSAPVGPGSLEAADAQAARALRRAEAAHTGLARHRPGGLDALVDPAEADAHARALLGPLLDSPALLETLRVWLSLHGGWDRTATALGVHRNTVRQRVARCATLLDADLEDAQTRMELWFALSRVQPGA